MLRKKNIIKLPVDSTGNILTKRKEINKMEEFYKWDNDGPESERLEEIANALRDIEEILKQIVNKKEDK